MGYWSKPALQQAALLGMDVSAVGVRESLVVVTFSELIVVLNQLG
ncbi:hypothetical protein SBV1_2470025 [Verrucomicrobia bacterium]|nr:hypothetical protein SBV1_2470025 [Verrucomicrobiota bacterium]